MDVSSTFVKTEAKEFVRFFWHYFFCYNIDIEKLNMVEVLNDESETGAIFRLYFDDRDAPLIVEESGF